MNFSVSDIWPAVKGSLRAIRKGEFLLKIKAHELYLHILYIFLLAWLAIFINLRVDNTLKKMEENRVALRNLEIFHAEKEAELVKIHSASATSDRLRELHSSVASPEKPATIVKK